MAQTYPNIRNPHDARSRRVRSRQIYILSATPQDVNAPPAVNAGIDQFITLPAVANLSATVTDDGAFTVAWSRVSGPAPVNFGSPTSVTTTATFTQPGIYVLRITADDGTFQPTNDVQITVSPALGAGDFFNFQPTGIDPPGGYTIDSGVAYTSDAGFGWTAGNLDARARLIQSDERLDTFAFVSSGDTGIWRRDLANGDYDVSLQCGDPGFSPSDFTVDIQGVEVINESNLAADSYSTVTDRRVTVSNGKLEIEIYGGAAGFAPINYITIAPVSSPVAAARNYWRRQGMLP